MPSTLTWIDHDAAARERSLRIIALFQEKETRDELGLGAIRDSIADQLFPGTSTIQTRLRYMLFVPWVYQSLESRRVPAAEFAARARKLELALVKPLLDSDDQSGVFGRLAGGALKRLPSSVYWAGLGAWGVRRFPGSQDDYHRSVDVLYRRRAMTPTREEGEAEPDPAAITWHPRIPKPPDGFPEKLTFTLRKEEAEFLLERIVTMQKDSLLAFLARECKPADVDFPWEHPDYARFSRLHQELLGHARVFSEVMHGAAVLYNLALAVVAGRTELIGEHRLSMADWEQTLDRGALAEWSLPRFWELVIDHGHTITPAARRFVEDWVGLVRAKQQSLGDAPAGHELIAHREKALKKGRSRFINERARDQWGGYAGLGRFDYRWPKAQRFLFDLHDGLQGA